MKCVVKMQGGLMGEVRYRKLQQQEDSIDGGQEEFLPEQFVRLPVKVWNC